MGGYYALGLQVVCMSPPCFASAMCVLPIALDQRAPSLLLQLGIPPDCKTAVLRAHHVVGMAGEYCLRSMGGSKDDGRL
jgi:hypothetical protein